MNSVPSSDTSPHWPGRAPETPDEARLLWQAYLQSIETATDLRARFLETQAEHARDTMHAFRRVAELERLVAELRAEMTETRESLQQVEGWVAGQGRRIAKIASVVSL